MNKLRFFSTAVVAGIGLFVFITSFTVTDNLLGLTCATLGVVLTVVGVKYGPFGSRSY